MGIEGRLVIKALKTWRDMFSTAWFQKISQRGVRGIPDVIGCIHGKFVAIEFKASSKHKPTAIQAHTLEQISKAGGVAKVCSPENFKETTEALRKL